MNSTLTSRAGLLLSVTFCSVGADSSNQALAVTNQQSIVMLPSAADMKTLKIKPPTPGRGVAISSNNSSGLGRQYASTDETIQRKTCSAPKTSAPKTKGQVNAPGG